MGFREISIFFFAILSSNAEACSFSVVSSLGGILEKQCSKVEEIQSIKMDCTSPADPTCKSCSEAVDTLVGSKEAPEPGTVQEALQKYGLSDSQVVKKTATTMTGLGSSGDANSTLGALTVSNVVDETGKKIKTDQQIAAAAAQKVFQDCSKKIIDQCTKVSKEHAAKPQAVLDVCEAAKGIAAKDAADAQVTSTSLDDMAKLLKASTAALGAASTLSKLLAGSPTAPPSTTPPCDPVTGCSGTSTSPTPGSLNTSPTTSSLTGGNGAGQSSIGFGTGPGNGVGASILGTGGGTASGGTGDSGTGSSSPSRGLASISSPLGTAGAGGAIGASGGGSGAGASGASNSTGASKPQGATGASANGSGSGFESSSGFGGRGMMLGLKPSKAEADALADLATPGALDAANADLLGVKSEAGDSASAHDTLAQDGESIFFRVRQKYSLLKGAGKI